MGVVLHAAEAVSQAADLSDDQVDEGVDQLIKDLQVLVLLEAAETLSEDRRRNNTGSVKEELNMDLTESTDKNTCQTVMQHITVKEIQGGKMQKFAELSAENLTCKIFVYQ